MLKQMIKENLESVIESAILQHSQDETLAYDLAAHVSKQCVTDEDVEKCLESMLEHISEKELELMFKLTSSELYKKYIKATGASMGIVQSKVNNTLYLLLAQKGEA